MSAITYVRKFLANRDLPRRFAEKWELNADDTKTGYSQGPERYVTSPIHD